MAQGKLKVKTKTPASVKTKAIKKQKGPASQRRGSESIIFFSFNLLLFFCCLAFYDFALNKFV